MTVSLWILKVILGTFLRYLHGMLVFQHFSNLSEDPNLRKGAYALIGDDIKRIFGILSEVAKEVNTRSVSEERIDELPEDYSAEKFQEFQEDRDVMSAATKHEIDLSKRERLDGLPAPKTQASGNEVPPSGPYG